jgi:hypothetical protein
LPVGRKRVGLPQFLQAFRCWSGDVWGKRVGFLRFLQVSPLHTSGVGRKRVGPPNFAGVFASGVKAPDETERNIASEEKAI